MFAKFMGNVLAQAAAAEVVAVIYLPFKNLSLRLIQDKIPKNNQIVTKKLYKTFYWNKKEQINILMKTKFRWIIQQNFT